MIALLHWEFILLAEAAGSSLLWHLAVSACRPVSFMPRDPTPGWSMPRR